MYYHNRDVDLLVNEAARSSPRTLQQGVGGAKARNDSAPRHKSRPAESASTNITMVS